MDNSFFSQLKSELAQYGQTVGKMGQLHLIGIISRVLGLFLLIFTTVLCVMAFLAFCAVAAINALAFCMPVWAAALIVGAAYLLLLFCAIICRTLLKISRTSSCGDEAANRCRLSAVSPFLFSSKGLSG